MTNEVILTVKDLKNKKAGIKNLKVGPFQHKSVLWYDMVQNRTVVTCKVLLKNNLFLVSI